MTDAHVGQSASDDPGDVYRDLPPELIAVLRDPRVILPGEMDVYEGVGRWVDANTVPPTRAIYVEANGSLTIPRSDT